MRIRPLPQINVALQQQCWQIVRDCLVTLHGWSEERAKRAAADLYRRVAALPDADAIVLLYHTEPIDLANDIAGEAVDFYEHRAQYQRILARHQAEGVRVPSSRQRGKERAAERRDHDH